MTGEQEWVHLLKAGYSSYDQRWEPHRLWLHDVSLLGLLVDRLVSQLGTIDYDYVCALRGTGLALGVLLSMRTQKPLLWFRDCSLGFLFPRYIDLTGKRVVMVDSHFITGLNMLRHTALLNAIGTKSIAAVAFLDVDTHSREAPELFEGAFNKVLSVWRWSELEPLARASKDPEIIKIMNSYDKFRERFWRSREAID